MTANGSKSESKPMLKKLLTRRLLFTLPLFLCSATLLILFASSSPRAESIMREAIPATASNLLLHVENDLLRLVFGEFEGYARFELSPQDAHTFMNQSTFILQGTTDQPASAFLSAVSGSTPMTEIVYAANPDWWQPRDGTEYIVGRLYQDQYTTAGPDLTWYLVDISAGDSAIVYMFAVEV
jgi:hypothetical protein